MKACSLLLLGFLLCTALVYCQAQIALVGFRLQALEKSIDRLRAENQLLETSLESLTTPDRLEAIAKKQLGMVYPSSAAGEIVLPPVNQGEAAKEENKGRRGWLEEFLQFLAAHLGQRGA
ncbi:cell division protein FtsL [Ammonifex degensii]|uniref:cell division protein FtsL n=1 Tax=Ammonifex degensii TaxID=42838 RepID=UPI00031319EA|nr:cell division protein FtsL [Ammonifex degensii]